MRACASSCAKGSTPTFVVRTANEILAGENQTARGDMIRFLADLELYRHDGGCPVCRERAENPVDVEAKLSSLLARSDS